MLDVPTTGLHAADVDRLLQLHRLADACNTPVVTEHEMRAWSPKMDWMTDRVP